MSNQHKTDGNQPRLLIPMNIEALVLGAKPSSQNKLKWVDQVPLFQSIYYNTYLGQDLESEPCGENKDDLYDYPGIYLHWSLPDGLTHGVTAENGSEPEFPLIPNRWLIVRTWDKADNGLKPDLDIKAWILENDTITDDDTAIVWPALKDGNPDPDKETDYYVYIGRQFELEKWPGETGAPGVDITAVGYGDAAFAAYYPACGGILGFCDKQLDDLPKNISLTYFVAGWYSDPAKDPLGAGVTDKTFESLAEILDERQWTYPGFEEIRSKAKAVEDLDDLLKETREMHTRVQLAAAKVDRSRLTAAHQKVVEDNLTRGETGLLNEIDRLESQRQVLSDELETIKQDVPAGILCHGVLSGVQWLGKDKLYDSGIPRGKPFSVAVGNTAVEALSALFEEKLDSSLVKLLEAFQYDLLGDLEKPGGLDRIDQKIHERAFKPLGHGIQWEAARENQIPTADSGDDHSVTPADDEPTPPLPGDIRYLLENLNRRQREINRLQRERDSLKSELYATWYKKVLNAGLEDEKKHASEHDFNQMLDQLQHQIGSITSRISDLEHTAEGRPHGGEWDRLQKKLSLFCPDTELQKTDEPRFWRPNDPVVLMAGVAFKPSHRHGSDGRLRTDGQLLCRLSGQEITGIKMTVPFAKKSDVEFGPADIDRWYPSFFDSVAPYLPAEIADLFRESLLLTLDPAGCHDIAAVVYNRNEPGLADKSPDDVRELASTLMDQFNKSKRNWRAARDSEIEVPDMGYTDGQTAWGFLGKFPSPVVLNGWDKNPWLPLYLQWRVKWVPATGKAVGGFEKWKLNDQGTSFKWTGEDPDSEESGFSYSGTALLTPDAAVNLSDRLRRYNLTHSNPALEKMQTAISEMNLLCQNLGGFTDNLLTRKAYLELKPLDPGPDGVGPRFSPIYDAVRDIDWLSPLTNTPFLPVRAGHLKLESLWIVDAFGQLLMLEDKTEPYHETVGSPHRPAAAAASGGYLRLEPRLDQPARLTVDWPAATQWNGAEVSQGLPEADPDFGPVCGWILPNFLDSGLMIYDARGNALGALQAVKRKFWDEVSGAERQDIESFHWIDIPGSDSFYFGRPPEEIKDPLGKNANPHLRAFVDALLSLSEGSGQAFKQLLAGMNETLSAGSTGYNPNLALLIGKPLALVRALIGLELNGLPARAQGWADLQNMQTDEIERFKVPIRLGDRRQSGDLQPGEDGLVGYFLDQNYCRFFPAHGLKGDDDQFSKFRRVPEISIAEPLDFTLLMDPSRGISATTGILPRKVFHLPFGDITDLLENKQVVFYTGPIICPENSANQIQMPQPSDVYGQWAWTHHPEVKVWQDATISDSQKASGQFADNLQISEGWLKLVTAPLEIRAFKVKGLEPLDKEPTAGAPERFEVQAGQTLILSWVVIGAEAVELKQGNISLFESSRHPLPTQIAVKVNQQTQFTLTASGRAAKIPTTGAAQPESMLKTIEVIIGSER